ncbi:MAG: hypothetical protein ACYC5N_11290, partial [Endomicrobiales bacterium]
TYQVKATKDGYWPKTSSPMDVGATPVTCPLTLKQMALGAVTGYVFINDHPVISKVCASTITLQGEDAEFVEIYNPTTSSWAMDDSSFEMKYVDENNVITDVGLVFLTPSVAPQSYFLVANTGTIVLGGYSVRADAKYAGSDLRDIVQSAKRGGVIISPDGAASDKVGWGPGVGAAPSNAVEYSGITTIINDGCAMVRKTVSTALFPSYSNAFDSDNNSTNFFSNLNIGSYRAVSSTAPARPPLSGSP